MSVQVQLRRGTTAEIAGVTPAAGEAGFDTAKKTLIVGDGTTPGGHPMAKEAHGHVAFAGATSGAAGSAGFVPAPAAGQQGRLLRGDGTWAALTDIGFVSYAAAQALTDAQKVQARANIGSAWEVLSGQTGFSGQAQLVSTIPAAVRAVKMTGTLVLSAAGLLYAQVSVDGGATWINTGYSSLVANIAGSSVSSAGYAHPAIQLSSNIPGAANGPVTFELSLDSLKAPTRKPRYRVGSSYEASGGGEYQSLVGGNIGGLASAINAIRILPQNGTLAGDLLVEGIR